MDTQSYKRTKTPKGLNTILGVQPIQPASMVGALMSEEEKRKRRGGVSSTLLSFNGGREILGG